VLAEIRIEALGAINAATAEFDRGLTVLTGETGTGKTMVVTGLHLLGGARADASRVRSGSERAVVEGRFTTTELGGHVSGRIDDLLDSSGAERDDDGSVIAARSVSRDGPSRAYLGGRSVPAKSLSTFTTELLALHGQNDQLRLMRPDEQRAALDRFIDVGARLARYRSIRDEWLAARRDLADRRQRARELAQEADRLQFGLNEIDTVAPQPGEDEALVADIRRLSELDALREAAQSARAALSGALDEVPESDAASAVDGVGHAKTALESTDDAVLRALGDRLGDALAVIGDVSTELGDYLAELPSDVSTLETKLARQGELRTLTRKYAADVDGVLSWAHQARERLSSPRLRSSPRSAPRPPRPWPRRSPPSSRAWPWPAPGSASRWCRWWRGPTTRLRSCCRPAIRCTRDTTVSTPSSSASRRTPDSTCCRWRRALPVVSCPA
jgi:DNA repair protein RecN (Recombination protein N)